MHTKARQAVEHYHMLCHGDCVIVGLSGGADSCALLHFLCQIREEYALTVSAVHINHLIRGEEAERDAAFAEEFCRRLDVPLRIYKRDVPAIAARRGVGLEECGRALRYEIFEQEAKACGGKIATAHTLSDSVETMLFHMIRGCSLHGLRGIPAVRGNIIRPLIWCERDDIEAYCNKNGLNYVTDSTNLSLEYTRNQIRLQLLPLMRQINPGVVKALGRLSQDAAADDDYLDELARRVAEQYRQTGDATCIKRAGIPVAGRAVVTICHEKWDISLEHRHVDAVLDALQCGKGSGNLPGNHHFCVKNGTLFFLSDKDLCDSSEKTSDWECIFLLGEIITPYSQKIIVQQTDQTKYDIIRKIYQNVFQNSLDYDKIKHAIFRFRREGDSFRQAGRGHTKRLKKLFNERRIPVGQRYRVPLLVCGDEIAWIDGIGVAEAFRVTPDTRNIVYILTDPPDSDGAEIGADFDE